MMFDSVSNKMQRSEFISLLTHIVNGTQSAAGFAFAPEVEVSRLLECEPLFVTLDVSVKNKDGQIKAVATQAAIDALNGNFAKHAAKPAPAKKPTFEIVTLKEIPGVARGGRSGSIYPFDQLAPFPQPGNAFFVEATETRPNPAKSLASIVASATKRNKEGKKFTIRKHTDVSGTILGAYIIREK